MKDPKKFQIVCWIVMITMMALLYLYIQIVFDLFAGIPVAS